MHVKLFLLCIFQIVSQCKNFASVSNQKVSVSQKNEGGKSSLVFVFDTTGSMARDLRQLQEGAELILNAALEESSSIEDFVFVPFHDPGVGPATITRDKDTFKNALKVNVIGGKDCPEMSLGGILLALESSRPKSQVYVFTDATAKDHLKLPEVLDKLQQTQSQVVFVLTGHCNDLKRPSYQAYQKVAAASSGQVFNLNKTSVHNVLDFVRNSLKGRRVNLGSSINPAGYNHTQKIPIDNTLGEVTVSVSGVKPRITIVDPRGEELTGPPKLVTALDLSEIMIVKVLQPEPGNWSITVGSENDHSVKVVGMSNLTFNHGFSVENPQNIDETSYRPLQGTYNHLLIHLTGPTSNVDLKYVEIINLDGRTLFEVPLRVFDEDHNVYMADAFLPPKDMFYIAINGVDNLGQELRRIGSTAVQAKLPDAPLLKTRQKIEAKLKDTVVLECKVQSLVPVTAMWTQYGRRIQEQKASLQTTNIQYTIDNISEYNVGTYTCFAKNVAGISTLDTEVVMIVDPPQVAISPVNMTSQPDDDVTISCTVYSDVVLSEFQLRFSGTDTYAVDIDIIPNPEGVYTYNKTLQHVTEANQGTYSCIASNREGQTIQSSYISIQSKPTAQILGPHTIAKQTHTQTQIMCNVNNADKVIWRRQNVTLKEEKVKGMSMSVLDYNVTENVDLTCVAVKGVHQASDTLTITVLIKPQVSIIGERDITLLEGESRQVTCDVIASPPPRIVWHKETEVFLNHNTYPISPQHYTSIITINSTDDQQNRTYFCIGENSVGIGQDSVEVMVRREMRLVEGFTDQQVQIYSQVELKCLVDSYPLANITWYHNGTKINITESDVKENNTVLQLHKVDFKDTGEYICRASNGFENIIVNGTVKLSGLETPVLFKEPVTILIKEGTSTNISCRILKSEPQPDLTWFLKNSSKLSVSRTENSLDLILNNVTTNDEGTYVCSAQNVIGKDTYNITLTVQSTPKILERKTESQLQVQSGEKLVLNCEAEGKPTPQVIWYFEGQPVIYNGNTYLSNRNDLTIKKVSEYDVGVYSCVAKNVLGEQRREFKVQVYDAPKIISLPSISQIDVLEGDLVELPCQTSGVPIPRIVWTHNGGVVGGGKYIDGFGIRFVANLTDFGEFKCLVENEFGNDSVTYDLRVWVRPSIEPPLRTSVIHLLGSNISVNCNAVGFPVPVVLWEYQSRLLTENSSDVSFNDVGNLYITYLDHKHEGLYSCIAENIAGLAKKNIYLNVQEPPTIHSDNYSDPYLATTLDSSLVIPCRVTGKPRPYVLWAKDGFYLNTGDFFGISIDGSLTIKQPTEELSGEYTCIAKNIHGIVERTSNVQIYSIPRNFQSEESRTVIKAVEGTDINVTCPLKTTHNDYVKWYKDAQLISSSTLNFPNISRQNETSFACVLTNLAYSSYINVDLVVEWQPKFVRKENRTKEVIKGYDVYVSCENDAKPTSRIKWYFNSSLLRGQDKDTLKITDVQENLSGVYKCIVSNDHGSISRDFQLQVLVEPFISEFDILDVELKEGTEATLDCNPRGVPKPTVKWTYNNTTTNWRVYENSLVSNITVKSEGSFRCDASNKAGRAYIVYNVGVISDPRIREVVTFENGEGRNVKMKEDVMVGNRIRIACYASGRPTPKIQWLRNGIIFGENKIHQNNFISNKTANVEENLNEVSYADFVIENVQSIHSGEYKCVANNVAGIDEKKILLAVLEPPKIIKNADSYLSNITKLEVILGQTFYLHCHPLGNPMPSVYWFKDGISLRLFDQTMTSSDFGEVLVSQNALVEQSGNYTCVARNSVGNASVVYLVDVLVPPPPLKEAYKLLKSRVNNSVNLTCPVQGVPRPSVTWIKLPYLELSGRMERVGLSDDNCTLIISNTKITDTGNYTCIMTNKVGTTEFTFDVVIEKPPSIAGNAGNRNVETHAVPLKRSVVMKCEVDGHPTPKISWLKNTQPIPASSAHIQNVLYTSVYVIWSVEVTDASNYICLAENSAGVAHRRYNVIVKVPGKFGSWSKWSLCNSTCGLGYQNRSRSCQYIDEYNNTIDETTTSDRIELDVTTCVGHSIDRRKCHMPPCEEDTSSHWGAWSKWSKCSVTCGVGTQGRSRQCKSRVPCSGDNIQIRQCPDLPACYLSSEDNSANNEVLVNTPDQENPYSPEATFEVQPEIDNIPPDAEEDPTGNKHSSGFFDVKFNQNLDGSRHEPCDVGYKYNYTTQLCDDIDECSIENNHCHMTQVCVNTAGGYRCGCGGGFRALGVGRRCLDINECMLELHGCEFSCVNVAGGYVCACPTHTRLHADRRHCVAPSAYRKPLDTLTSGERMNTIYTR